MKRALALVILGVGSGATTASAAEPPPDPGREGAQLGLGVGLGTLLTERTPYLGDASEIGRGLGSRVDESSWARLVPVLSQTIWFGPSRENQWTLGIEATERWWSMWSRARSPATVDADHQIERSVLAIDAALVGAWRPRRESLRLVVGVGPVLYRVTARERGWLGDTNTVDLRPGLRASIGPRFVIGGGFHAALDASLEWWQVPGHNPVLRDGGGAVAVMLGTRIEILP
jgi:hypothetical protein